MKKTTHEKWRLSLAFAIVSFPVFLHAQVNQNTTSVESQIGRNQNYVNNWEKGGSFDGYSPKQELTEKRAKNAKHFRNSDGTFTAQVGGNYHYKDATGNWQDIDLSLEQGNTGVQGYFFQNVKNDVKSYFPQNASTEGVLMKLEDGATFTWWKNPQFKITNNGNVTKSFQAAQVVGQVSREKLIYDNIYNGISEEFVILNGGIENNIILNSLTSEIASLNSNSNLEFSQFIPLNNNWSIFDAEGKRITSNTRTTDFSVKLGNSSIYFGKIIVFDNNISKEDAMLVNIPREKLTPSQKQKLSQSVYSITYQIKFVDGGIEIISALPASWVNQPNRAFPVVIDPTVTITPINSSGYFYGPMTHWYGYQRYANIYLQSEIGTVGTITDIEYNRTNTNGSAGSRPTKVFMNTTANTTLSTGAWNSVAYTGGAQLCLDENTDQGSTAGWKNLHLSTPFIYGQDNLMIMVYDAWGGSGSAKWYNQSTSITQRQAYSRADGTDPGDGVNLAVENVLQEIRITYIPATECTGLPASATATSSAAEVCTNAPFTLSLSGVPLESGLSIQWQSSTDGTTWNNFGTVQTTLSYSVPSQSVATDYKAIITCVPTGDVLESSIVSVNQSIPNDCYCINTIPANCTDGDVITNVTIESINNNSTCGNSTTGYSDYTTSVTPAQLEIGTTIPMSVTVGPSGDGWLYESVGVWIDYNQNGVLDSLEGEYTNLGTGLNEVITGNIIIPSTALPGATRMRVVVMASEVMLNSFSCGPVLAINNFGEIEDYTVNLFRVIVIDSVVVSTQGNVPAAISTPSGTLQLVSTVYPLTEDQSVVWSINTLSGNATISTSGLVTGLSNGTVWAKAVSVEDNTKADSILITITNQDLGISNVNLADFTIFPNPTEDIIMLKSGVEHTSLQLSVMDITGKVVFQDNLIDNELNNGYQVRLDSNSVGVYIIQLKNDKINVQRQVIKK